MPKFLMGYLLIVYSHELDDYFFVYYSKKRDALARMTKYSINSTCRYTMYLVPFPKKFAEMCLIDTEDVEVI